MGHMGHRSQNMTHCQLCCTTDESRTHEAEMIAKHYIYT